MKFILLITIVACSTSLAASEPDSPLPESGTIPAAATNAPPPASADELLSNALACFPQKPLTIAGDLVVRRPRGVPVLQRKFEIAVDWGADPIVAQYTIRAESGADLERMTVTRTPGKPPAIEYAAGNPLAAATAPDMLTPVQESDMCWLDLTLSFLWWKGGSITGTDKIRGFDCYIVDIPAPDTEKGGQYARVRLWIEKKINVMLQAEGYGAEDQLLRRLWVRSCKKIDDTWMIKDLEVQRFPVRHRTKLHINDVRINTNI